MNTTEQTETGQQCGGCSRPIEDGKSYPARGGTVNCPECHTRRIMGW